MNAIERTAGSASWIDPREYPNPPLRVGPRRLADDPSEILELLRLVRGGQVYAVEEWVRSGRPLQPKTHLLRKHRVESPLQAALRSRQHDLVLLLLCNGYVPDLERESPLEIALRLRATDLLDLLLKWGADPKRVDPESVLDTYRSDLMEHFWTLGVDYTLDRCLASYLAHSTSNRPAYGWARRHREEPGIAKNLAMALGEAIAEDREKAVQLLVWAGADPHRRVPSLRWGSEDDEEDDDARSSAVEVAVAWGKESLLVKLKPDPRRDRFESLWPSVRDTASLDVLAALEPPADWSPTIRGILSHIAYSFREHSDCEAKQCLERAHSTYGARLTILGPEESADLRRSLLRQKNSYDVSWVLGWLRNPRHCEPTLYQELTRTPAMQERLAAAGLGGSVPKSRQCLSSEATKRRS